MLQLAGLGSYRDAYVARYALQPTPGDERPADNLELVLAGRALDGAALAGELRPALRPAAGAAALPAEPAIAAADRARLLDIATAWLGWYDTLSGTSGQAAAWQPERMEYTFAVAAGLPGDEVSSDLVYDRLLEPKPAG